MFQSSRITSSNPRLQTSSAFSPSSASTIWKASPSRIRLATLRMTLESSTTKHVFISASNSPRRDVSGAVCLSLPCACRLPVLGRQHIRHDFENAIDVEHDHQLTVEAMHAAGELGHARIEIDGIFFAALVGKLEHFADLIDQQAIGFAAQVDAHRHRRLAVIVLRQPETGTHVDNRDDTAAQV